MDVQLLKERPDHTELLRQVEESFGEIAEQAGMPCGLPVSAFVFQEGVYLEPAFVEAFVKWATSVLPEIQLVTPPEPVEPDEWVLHASWTTKRPWRGQLGVVRIYRNRITGKFEKEFKPFTPWTLRLEFALKTTAVQMAYGNVEAEIKARRKLEGMLAPRQLKSWILSESFYEQGRSGMVYYLRKNRPTIALRPDTGTDEDGKAAPVCALCLHAIGGYAGTGAGVLAPSDDIIAHLVMIRGNEHLFWRKANQFALSTPSISLL